MTKINLQDKATSLQRPKGPFPSVAFLEVYIASSQKRELDRLLHLLNLRLKASYVVCTAGQ